MSRSPIQRRSNLPMVGMTTVASAEQRLPWGWVIGEGQSERWKPDPRCDARRVASSRLLEAEASDPEAQYDGPTPASTIARA